MQQENTCLCIMAISMTLNEYKMEMVNIEIDVGCLAFSQEYRQFPVGVNLVSKLLSCMF